MMYTEQEVLDRERLARLYELQEVRAALPAHDNGQWLATQIDERIAVIKELRGEKI